MSPSTGAPYRASPSRAPFVARWWSADRNAVQECALLCALSSGLLLWGLVPSAPSRYRAELHCYREPLAVDASAQRLLRCDESTDSSRARPPQKQSVYEHVRSVQRGPNDTPVLVMDGSPPSSFFGRGSIGRTILVTGITGFVGGAVAARLASTGATLSAVVRADHRPAVERVAGSLARFLGRDAAGAVAGRMALVVGGLADERTYADPAFARVTHVVHCAASTSFGRADPWPSNVGATRLLATRMQASAGLRRFLHVGTAYCCGDAPSATAHEDDAPRPEHRHVNAYAQSKAEAELHLRSLDRFPLVVARPSVIVGHASLGVRPSSSLFWYYRALAILGAGPTGLGVGRDVVPVDHVAEALERLLFLDAPRHVVYHVSAGRSASTMRGIVAALGMEPARWQVLSPEALGALAERTPALGRTPRERQRVARAVVACSRFGALGIEAFDNARILGEGLRPPPPFHEYLGRCVATTGDATVHDQMVDDV